MTDYSYHSLQIGILPKININQFSIDIDRGVKIHLSVSAYSQYISKRNTKIIKENYNLYI